MSDTTDPSKTNPDPSKDPAKDDKKGKDPEAKTFTQEDLDRVAAERAKRAEEKFNKELDERLKKEREEWDRQAKLSAEEKEAEERKKREQETATKEREITLRENRADARELLQEKKISTKLVDFLVDVDADKTKSNIEEFEKAYLEAVEKGVESKLKGETPKDKSAPAPNSPIKGTRVL